MSASLNLISEWQHEKVLFVNNEKAGLHAIIAVHNTKLGPAIGGCRLYPYHHLGDALFDVLRLSHGSPLRGRSDAWGGESLRQASGHEHGGSRGP